MAHSSSKRWAAAQASSKQCLYYHLKVVIQARNITHKTTLHLSLCLSRQSAYSCTNRQAEHVCVKKICRLAGGTRRHRQPVLHSGGHCWARSCWDASGQRERPHRSAHSTLRLLSLRLSKARQPLQVLTTVPFSPGELPGQRSPEKPADHS